jgi:hypothetical protein
MRIAFVAESHQGVHSPPFGGVDFFSTRGSSPLFFSEKGFSISKSLASTLNSYDAVIVGTDFDHAGTVLATAIRNSLTRPEVLRAALAGDGYVRGGPFYSQKEMDAVLERYLKSRQVRSFFRQKFGVPLSLTQAAALGALYGKKGERFRVKSGKTATATALVKGLIKGSTPKAVASFLQKAYSSGRVEYPRVEADYFPPDDRFQVYAHSALTSRGYRHPLLTPFEEEELPLNAKTAALYLEEERLLTPSLLFEAAEKIEEFYEEDLTPKDDRLLRECRAVYEAEKEFLENSFRESSPNYPIYLVPAPKPGGKRKPKEEELLEALKEALRREEEEFKRRKKRESALLNFQAEPQEVPDSDIRRPETGGPDR